MRNSQLVTVSLPREVLEQVDAAAAKERRSRSNFIRAALENSLTGQQRLDAPQAIADVGLEEANVPRERAPNATEIIAASSTEGHARLRALGEIAAGNRKVTT